MKHQNITFSIPEDLKAELQAHVRRGQLSQFITEAIFEALRSEELKKVKELDAAYKAANVDSDRLEILEDWDKIDDLSELVTDEENWDWLKIKREEKNKS